MLQRCQGLRCGQTLFRWFCWPKSTRENWLKARLLGQRSLAAFYLLPFSCGAQHRRPLTSRNGIIFLTAKFEVRFVVCLLFLQWIRTCTWSWQRSNAWSNRNGSEFKLRRALRPQAECRPTAESTCIPRAHRSSRDRLISFAPRWNSVGSPQEMV